MNRRDFFKEIGRSLMQTGKEAVSPIVEHDIAKLNLAADILSGRDWYPITAPAAGYGEQMVNGEIVGLFRGEKGVVAFDKQCCQCRQLVQWLSYAGELRCPLCGRSYSPAEEAGDLALRLYPVREDAAGFWVAMPQS
ncbi:MAG: hypothetical protein ABF868_08535 [Sporolactobacillus sp.]